MKLKINKACDLSSISVLPPQARRSNTVPTAPPASQLRSQQSQQSFSQSQHGMFSQLSQNSLDEIVTNDQRFGSQERENSVKRISSLAPVSYSQEESQMPISRSSTNIMRKWNSASVPDHRCQISEELEQRIGMMETSLSRFGMVLDAVQSDVMQVNKGTKEVSLELETMRQKSTVNSNSLQLMNKGQEDIKASLDEGLKAISDQLSKDMLETMRQKSTVNSNSLQLMNKGQEDIKASLDEGLKAISDQLSKDMCQDKLQETLSVLSALPEQIEVCLLKLKNNLCSTFTKELQAVACSLKAPNQNYPAPSVLPSKGAGCHVTSQKKPPPLKNPGVPPKVCVQAPSVRQIETGSRNSVKIEQTTFPDRGFNKECRQKGIPPMEQGRECRVIIDSDEEIDGGFSCLFEEKEIDTRNFLAEEAQEETERILRKARRKKRKYSNAIIII